MSKIGFFNNVEFKNDHPSSREKALNRIDHYFFLGGKKAVVLNARRESSLKRVEIVNVKISFWEKIAKIISYCFFPVSLSMLAIKGYLRSKYQFVEHVRPERKRFEPAKILTEDQGFEAALEKAKAVGVKVLPAKSSLRQQQMAEYDHFKKEALESLRLGPLFEESFKLPELSKDQKATLRELNRLKYDDSEKYKHLPAQVIRGGEHWVFLLNDLPGFVFKPIESVDHYGMQQEISNYLCATNQAWECIEDNELFLLHVPQTAVYSCDGQSYIIQQKESLVTSQYFENKGLFQALWEDPDMRIYMKELFSQLLIFIIKTGFSKVRYDNLPLTNEGRIALFDLDQKGIHGLYRSGAGNSHGGLLQYVPFEFFDEFYEKASEKLSEGEKHQLDAYILKIRPRLEKRPVKWKRYADFAETNQITQVHQLLNPDLTKLFDDESLRGVADRFLERINEGLQKSKNFSLRQGRKVRLNIEYSEKKDIEKICGILKENGVIFNYSFNPNYRTFLRVNC